MIPTLYTIASLALICYLVNLAMFLTSKAGKLTAENEKLKKHVSSIWCDSRCPGTTIVGCSVEQCELHDVMYGGKK